MIAVHVAHLGGQAEDVVGPVHPFLHPVQIPDIPLDENDLVHDAVQIETVAAVGGEHGVHHGDLGPLLHEKPGDGAADHAGAAGDEDPGVPEKTQVVHEAPFLSASRGRGGRASICRHDFAIERLQRIGHLLQGIPGGHEFGSPKRPALPGEPRPGPAGTWPGPGPGSPAAALTGRSPPGLITSGMPPVAGSHHRFPHGQGLEEGLGHSLMGVRGQDKGVHQGQPVGHRLLVTHQAHLPGQPQFPDFLLR